MPRLDSMLTIAVWVGTLLPIAPACAPVGASRLRDRDLAQPGDEIVVCGERIHVGLPVVLWSDPGGYSAYNPGPVRSAKGPIGLRYEPGRAGADLKAGIDRAKLSEAIDLLVLHYDACGFSRRCYELLQDEVILSAHFLLDVDGTLYQTLDLRDQAWHGRFTNPRSIGIEMAQIGVYPTEEAADDPHKKRRWYVRDGDRLRMEIPSEFGDPRIREPGPFYSARNQPIEGCIHGKAWKQVDFTPEQYATLIKLTAALRQIFPRIALKVPRTPEGAVRTDQLSRAEIDAFQGILGHYHITTERNDPGPAFDWERLLREVHTHSEQRGVPGRRPDTAIIPWTPSAVLTGETE